MVERIWLHIGAEKTGTTSLQHWLMANRRALLQRSVLFPESTGDFNHISLAAYALDASKGVEELRISCGASKFRNVNEFRQHLEHRLANEIFSNAPSQIIFSNEHCSSRLRSASEIAKLREILYQFCGDIKVILYIREPLEFFASWYSTSIASGGTAAFPTQPTPEFLKAADWLTMARMWSGVFGSGSVILRRFARKNLAGGTIERDFCNIVGLNIGAFEPTEPKNESLGIKPLLFLRTLNKTLPRFVDGKFNPERGNIVEALRELPAENKFVIPRETGEFIKSFYRESYDLLKEIYFHDEPGPLFPEPEPQAPSQTTLTEDDIFAIVRHLWVRDRKKRS